jgi:hypothetical protein
MQDKKIGTMLRFNEALKRMTGESDRIDSKIKKCACPINITLPEFCSAGTCYECLVDRVKRKDAEIARLREAITKWSIAKKQAYNNPKLLLSNVISHQEAAEIMNTLFALEANLEALAQGEQNE